MRPERLPEDALDVSDSLSYDDHPNFSQSTRFPASSVNFKIQLVHFVLGSICLLPSTLLVTAMPFFQSRVLETPFATTFSSYLCMAHNASAFIFLTHATAVSKSSSPTRQTRLTILALLSLILFTTLSTVIRTTPGTFLTFIMLVAVLSAAAVSYFQTPVFAVASIFGPKAVQAVMAGQGAAEVMINLVHLGSAAISFHKSGETLAHNRRIRTPEDIAAFVSFVFTTCILCISLVAHRWLVKSPAYKFLIGPIEQRIVAANELEESQTLLSSSDLARTPDREKVRERIVRVAKANVLYEIAVAYVFVVTLSVFPPITSAIQPVNPWYQLLLFRAIHVLLFSIGDLLGRHLCSLPSLLIWSPHQLLGLSLAHTLFIPLFIACNIQLPSSSPLKSGLKHFLSSGSGWPPLIHSDVLFFLILLAFRTSNGYISTLCLMAGSSLQHNKELKDQEDVDTAATIGLFCMVGGLTVGSFASFAIRMVVCKCNPFVG